MVSHRPRQVVVLAGGLGTRLGEITKERPKPLVDVAGVPFLSHLFRLFVEAGFERALLLLGYKADMVVDYCRRSAPVGLQLDVSVSPVEDDTGERIRRARDRLDPLFMLSYCDNYLPFSFDRLWSEFRERGAAAQIMAFDNPDGYSRNNLVVDADGFVRAYDKRRERPGLNAVDLGFALLPREIVDILPAGNCSFEASVYPELAVQGALGACMSRHRYYGVGSPKRLADARRFMMRGPAVMLDVGDAAPDPLTAATLEELKSAGVEVLPLGKRDEGGGDTARPEGALEDAVTALQRARMLDLGRTPLIATGERWRRAAWNLDQPFFDFSAMGALDAAVAGALEFLADRGQGKHSNEALEHG